MKFNRLSKEDGVVYMNVRWNVYSFDSGTGTCTHPFYGHERNSSLPFRHIDLDLSPKYTHNSNPDGQG